MAIVSLLIAGALLVYWWRSYHGHSDTLTLGSDASTKTQFWTEPGAVWVKVTQAQKTTDAQSTAMISGTSSAHRFKEFMGYFLLIPGLWLAIKIRNWLPRPPGREVRNPKSEIRKKSK